MESIVTSYMNELKKVALFPRHIQIGEWNSWSLVSCYDEICSNFISESVRMGIDKTPEIAIMKALTEYCERKVSKNNKDVLKISWDRTDGCAAYPTLYNRDSAISSARRNAFNEACERYLWATWWDNLDCRYTLKPICDGPIFPDILNIIKEFSYKQIYEILIPASNVDVTLTILIGETLNGGYVTGGACSENSRSTDRLMPAFGELLRHSLSYRKMLKSRNQGDLSFYERRLLGFASGSWSSLVKRRLSLSGGSPIVLPELEIDTEISHNAQDIVKVYRCLFKNQPIFMGGNVDRLCI